MRNLNTIYQLFYDFRENINNRLLPSLLYSDEGLLKIFEWDFKIWKKENYYLSDEKNSELFMLYSQLRELLNSIIKIIGERTLKEGKTSSYHFFRYLKKHSENCRGEGEYLNILFKNYFEVFYENVENSPASHEIWVHYFPSEWKVTKNNLNNKENLIPKILLDLFLNLAQERILTLDEKYDNKLDHVILNLFPEVEHTIWSKILIFTLSGYDPNNRIKSIIDRPWNFGYAGRVKSSWVPPNESEEERMERWRKSIESEKINTFELAVMLFGDIFSKENLLSYIEDLKNLEKSYDSSSPKQSKRKQLLEIFTTFLNFLNQ